MSLSEPPPRPSAPYARVVSRPARRRSGTFSSYLFLLLCASVVSLVMFCARTISLFGDIPELPFWGGFQSGLTMAFLLAAWQWRRWGLYGVVGITLIGTVLSLAYGQSLLESLIPLLLAVALPLLAAQSWDEVGDLEWRWEPEPTVAGPSQAPEPKPRASQLPEPEPPVAGLSQPPEPEPPVAGLSQPPEPEPPGAGLSQPPEPEPPRPGLPQAPVELRERTVGGALKDDMSILGIPPRPPVPYWDHPSPPPVRERTGCFSLYLLLIIFGGIFGLLLYLFQGDALQQAVPSLPDWAISWRMLESALGTVFGLGVWYWRRWGVFGLFVLIALDVFFNLGGEHSGAALLIGACQALIFALLLIPHWKHMEE